MFQRQTPELSQAFVDGGYERDVTSSLPMSSHSASAKTLAVRGDPRRKGCGENCCRRSFGIR